MSNPNTSRVGSDFKGVSKGKINYGGTNTVTTTSAFNSQPNVNVGSTFEGDQEVQSVITFNEKNLLNVVTHENTDQNLNSVSSEPSTPKVNGYKVEPSETLRIGSIVYNQCEDAPNIFTRVGSAVNATTVRRNVTNHLFCHGIFSGQHTDIGDVTIAENIEGDVTFNSDVKVLICRDQILKDLGFSINGHMTIFNQEFKGSIDFRAGSSNDVEYLTTTFKKFGIEPFVRLDLKYKDIVKEIDSLSRIDFSNYKLFVCVYMSHGHKNGYVSAADKEFNLRNTIIDPIMGNKSLNGIPKIFITVACRGEHNYEESDSVEFDGRITSTANGIDYSNCIISYSTYEGHVSKRKRDGTYFIQSLCDNINEDNGNTKIHSLFAKVNGKLAEMYKQVPVFETSMGDICFKDLASVPN